MRLIDADKLIERIESVYCEDCRNSERGGRGCENCSYQEFIYELEGFPKYGEEQNDERTD